MECISEKEASVLVLMLLECLAGIIFALHYWYFEIYKKRPKKNHVKKGVR